MLLIVAVLTIAFAVYYLAEVATAPMRTRRNLVHRAASYGARTASGKELPRFKERVTGPMLRQVGSLMLKINPRGSTDSVAKRLMAWRSLFHSPTSPPAT